MSRTLIIRGAFSIFFGILALLWPGATLYSIAALFGAYAFIDGCLSLVAGARGRRHWGSALLEGFAGIAAGVISWIWPGLTLFGLSLLFGLWTISIGVLELVLSGRARPASRIGRLLLALAGLFSIVFGIAIVARPVFGAIALVALIGTYAIIFGAMILGFGFHLQGFEREESEPRSQDQERHRAA